MKLLLGLVFLVCSSALAVAGDFKIPLRLATNNGVVDTLWFGVDARATQCIDPQLGEAEFPPKPPTPLFDARWVDPRARSHECLGQGVKVDLRATPDTYRVDFQAGPGGYPVVFSWPNQKGLLADSIVVMDIFGGKFIRIDMRSQTSLTIKDSAITSMFVINKNKGTGVTRKIAPHPKRLKAGVKPK